jgi:hypothetical protein
MINLSKLNSEEIIDDKDFDLIFHKTEFNSDLGRFIAEDEQTIIDNKKTLGDLYIAEYLNDFVGYWKSIDLEINKKTTDSFKLREYAKIKINMIKILREYSIYKGTSDFIKFVYNLYSHLTTSNFLNENEFVIGSYCETFSNFKNLEYNLIGNLPRYVWESIIKPCCHPAGWVCNYSGIDFTDDGEIISYDNHLRNNYCYIDYSATNSTINNYKFDTMQISQEDIINLNKQIFQFDSLVISTSGFTIIDEQEEGIL